MNKILGPEIKKGKEKDDDDDDEEEKEPRMS